MFVGVILRSRSRLIGRDVVVDVVAEGRGMVSLG